MQVRACFNQTIVQPIGGLLAVDAGHLQKGGSCFAIVYTADPTM